MRRHWSAGALLAPFLALCVSAESSESSIFSQASNESLFWGPYRPNVYFGLRPRIPNSVSTGLLWARVEDFTAIQHNVRYTCEQNEGMDGYGWDTFDPRTGGVQVIHDKGNGIDVETSFVKFDEGRGGWAARIKGTPREDAAGHEDLKTAVWFTVSNEGLGSVKPRDAEANEELGYPGDVVFDGQTPELGDFTITISEPKSNVHPTHPHESYDEKPLDRTFVQSLELPMDTIWQTRAILFTTLKMTIDQYMETYTQQKMPPPYQTYTIPNKPGPGNFHELQKTFEGSFEFDVFYTPSSLATPRTSDDLTKAIREITASFDKKYVEVLKPQAPFAGEQYSTFSKSLFSNLIGGIGYFHGDQVIDRSYAAEYEEEDEGFWQDAEEARARNQQKLEGPFELFTAVPSRPFFPRGFLWDEGFHLIPIMEWDSEITMQILTSYFNTMDEDGWIPREQILGAEARSKVPQEFQVQYPHYANPPTLFMALEALLDRAEGKQDTTSKHAAIDPITFKAWLAQLYPLLQRNYDWYRRTQAGDLKVFERPAENTKEGYRWRGRTPRHILTSGLDDYPRAQPPHPGELHVDLLSWIGLMTRSMERIASFLGESADSSKYAKNAAAISRNLDDLHWSSADNAYCDATVDVYEEHTLVCHKGYISLFPFFCGLLPPTHPHLGAVLALIADDSELWSPFGIRSLSRKSEHYGTDENYWRSPVWIPINYLIVKELLTLAQTPGPYQSRARIIYSALRTNLVETVYRSWRNTGFAWEQYNPETGAGQRTQHFTGWTSLVVKLMALPDLSAEKETVRDEL